MRRISLANAKAHLSKLVDDAEHHGRRIVILRHGKPAAAIVPVETALPRRARQASATERTVLRRSARAFIREFSRADPETSAVEDLVKHRR